GLSKRTSRDHDITSELEWFRLWRGWFPSTSRPPAIPSFRNHALNRNTDCSALARQPGRAAREVFDKLLATRSRQSHLGANFWFENTHQVGIPTDIIVRNVKHDHL